MIMGKTAHKNAIAIEELDDAERIDIEARREAKARHKADLNHTAAPHNMDGKNDKRTLLDDDPSTMEAGVRGRATYLIIREMLAGPTTRDHLIELLQEDFPEKELSVIKNTLGSLMHSLPIKRKWTVQKTKDKNDQRKVIFTVTDKGIDADGIKEATPVDRIRAHSLEGAHAGR
jgi:hypothetical protein